MRLALLALLTLLAACAQDGGQVQGRVNGAYTSVMGGFERH